MQEGLIYEGGTLAANCAGGDGCGFNPDHRTPARGADARRLPR
jgi:hypothetical protein